MLNFSIAGTYFKKEKAHSGRRQHSRSADKSCWNISNAASLLSYCTFQSLKLWTEENISHVWLFFSSSCDLVYKSSIFAWAEIFSKSNKYLSLHGRLFPLTLLSCQSSVSHFWANHLTHLLNAAFLELLSEKISVQGKECVIHWTSLL